MVLKLHLAILCFSLNAVVNFVSAGERDSLSWVNKSLTVQYASCKLLRNSNIGDGMLTIVRFDPSIFTIDLIEYKKNNLLKTPEFWVDSFDYTFVVNAGMYDLKDQKKHRFYMRNKGTENNPILDTNAKGMIAFNPFSDSCSKFKLFDLTTVSLEEISKSYQTIIQGYRLVDDNGKPVYWDRNDQFCSMVIVAQDNLGLLYFIFCRSPLTHNQMTENILSLDLGLKNAIYLEGGSKAAFSLKIGDFEMKKMGSYVSNYYPFNNNYSMPVFPNLIGFRF
jgi:hypothetical protein